MQNFYEIQRQISEITEQQHELSVQWRRLSAELNQFEEHQRQLTADRNRFDAHQRQLAAQSGLRNKLPTLKAEAKLKQAEQQWRG